MIPKKGYVIPRTRTAAIVPQIWNGFSQTGSLTRKIYGQSLRETNFIFNGKETTQVYKENEWNQLGQLILKKYIKSPNFFALILKLHNRYGKEAQVYARYVISKYLDLDLSESLRVLAKIKQIWLKFDQVNVPAWFIGGEFLGKYIKDQLEKNNVTAEDIATLFAANELSLAAQLDLAISRLSTKRNITNKELNYLSREFGWIPFGYDGPTYWQADYFKREIDKQAKFPRKTIVNKIRRLLGSVRETRMRQDKIRTKYHLTRGLRRLLDIVQELNEITDERKKFHFQLHYAYNLILSKLSGYSGLSFDELKTLDVFEITDMFRQKKFSEWKTVADKRLNGLTYIHIVRGATDQIIMGSQVKKYYNKYTEKIDQQRELIGQVGNASKTIIIGKVRVIKSSAGINRMKRDEILVTSMTTPDFVPAMKKARAIITDEGGITCHAAIVSRELGVPCVIGTKIATKILADGDRVAVDASKGIVKKI